MIRLHCVWCWGDYRPVSSDRWSVFAVDLRLYNKLLARAIIVIVVYAHECRSPFVYTTRSKQRIFKFSPGECDEIDRDPPWQAADIGDRESQLSWSRLRRFVYTENYSYFLGTSNAVPTDVYRFQLRRLLTRSIWFPVFFFHLLPRFNDSRYLGAHFHSEYICVRSVYSFFF